MDAPKPPADDQPTGVASSTHRLILALAGAAAMIASVFADYNLLIIGVGLVLLLAGAAPQALGPAIPWILKMIQTGADQPKPSTTRKTPRTGTRSEPKPKGPGEA